MLTVEKIFWLALAFVVSGLAVSALASCLLPKTQAQLVCAGLDNLVFFSSFIVLLIAMYMRGFENGRIEKEKEQRQAESHKAQS